jgi:4-hydroxybenzoate polyprenyltransferase
MKVVVDRLLVWGSLIRFSHSVFALPFAAIMLLAVARIYPVTWQQVVLLLVCVVAARSAAMAFNRVVDARIDARNERTKGREIPTGRVSTNEAVVLVIVASLVFIGGAFLLGIHCGVLSLPVLAVLCGYSFLKRFSSLCHLILGVALALAPGGVWYALTATWSWQPVPLMVSVMLWVAGFDILYSCQDEQFDRTYGLQSIPSSVGILGARIIAAGMHILSVFFLVQCGRSFGFGLWFWCGAIVFAVLIASQHLVVHRRGLESIDQVFFVRNGLASIALFLFVLVDQWQHHRATTTTATSPQSQSPVRE